VAESTLILFAVAFAAGWALGRAALRVWGDDV